MARFSLNPFADLIPSGRGRAPVAGVSGPSDAPVDDMPVAPSLDPKGGVVTSPSAGNPFADLIPGVTNALPSPWAKAGVEEIMGTPAPSETIPANDWGGAPGPVGDREQHAASLPPPKMSVPAEATRDDQQPLFAAHMPASQLERQTRLLIKDAQDFEDGLRQRKATPDEIAAAVNHRYGTSVTPAEVDIGDVWWKSVGPADLKSLGPDVPEYAAEARMAQAAEDSENAPAPMDVDARPAVPQQLHGVEGGASPGPQLTPQMRARIVDLASAGMTVPRIARAVSEETGQYVRDDLVQEVVGTAQADAEATKRQAASAESRRHSVAESWTPERRAAQSAAMSTPEALERQSETIKGILARPEIQQWLVQRGQELAKAKGQTAWTPELVERLLVPTMRAATAKEAADTLNAEFGTTLTTNAIRQKRSDLGYGRDQKAPKRWTPEMDEFFETLDLRTHGYRQTADAINEKFGTDISPTQVKDRQQYKLGISRGSGKRAGAVDWNEAESRLGAIMGEFPAHLPMRERYQQAANALNSELGSSLTWQAVQKRWSRQEAQRLRNQGQEPIFAASGWQPRAWLDWIGAQPSEHQDATPERDNPADPSQGVAGQQPGASPLGSPSAGSPNASGEPRGSSEFPVRGYVGRSLEAPRNALGLSRRYYYLMPPNAYFPTKGSDVVKLRILDQRVPNWQAKALATEIEPGVWRLEQFKVRKARAEEGLVPEFLDALQQQLGDLQPPQQMAPDAYEMWRNWERLGARWSSTSIDDYLEYKRAYYSPDALRAMQRHAAIVARDGPNSEDRNRARREHGELSDLVDKLSPEDIVAAVANPRFVALARLKVGHTVDVPPDVVAGMHEALWPLMGMVPPNVPVGVMSRIEPIIPPKPHGVNARATFTAENGDYFTVEAPADSLLGTWALFAPGSNAIGFTRFDLVGDLGVGLRGELGHELVHVLRRHNAIPEVAWGRLVRHGRDLRVLQSERRTFLQRIGRPDYNTVEPGVTSEDIYLERYKGNVFLPELLDQEAVAHTLELYNAGQLLPQEVEPVRDILDSILDGSIWRRGQGMPANGVGKGVAAAAGASGSEPLAAAQGVRHSPQDALGYYSHALEAARSLKQSKGTPEQMLAMLKSAGVKQGEIEATGLGAFLSSKSSVTRDEIVRHLEGNRVGLSEVQRETLEAYNARMEKSGAEPSEEYAPDNTYQGAPKWSAYSLDPDNPTYRETVLHLPASEGLPTKAEMQDQWNRLGEVDPAERERTLARFNQDFRSGHFPEPNIIGHMMTSMTRHNGKPVYTIDQIQSDWGQKLRDRGDIGQLAVDELKRRVEEAEPRYLALFKKANTDLTPEQSKLGGILNDHELGRWLQTRGTQEERAFHSEYQRLRAEMYNAEAGDRDTTPRHPLVNTTDQWTNTVLRRAIRQAAEADAAYIAIPTGDTVLSYNPGDRDGMNEFYNKIVPKNLRNLLQKIDKSSPPPQRVEKLETPTRGLISHKEPEATIFGNPQYGFTLFPLTDAVKDHVLSEGQPLFAVSGDGKIVKFPSRQIPEGYRALTPRDAELPLMDALRAATATKAEIDNAAQPLFGLISKRYGIAIMQVLMPNERVGEYGTALLNVARALRTVDEQIGPRYQYPTYGIYIKPSGRLERFEDGYSGNTGIHVPLGTSINDLAAFFSDPKSNIWNYNRKLEPGG